jgi:hypothetical protein
MNRTTLTVGTALLAFGCGGAESPLVDQAGVRDSGGVEIVAYPAGYEAELPVWVVVAEPLVDIGGREEPGHDLHQVGGAARLGDGKIVVVNRGSTELRVFDSTGAFLHAIGRRGAGPGEFSSLGTLQRLPGDSLLIFDLSLQRASLFSPSGQFVRSASSMARAERRYVQAVARLSDGRYLGVDNRIRDMRETSGPVRRDPMALVVVDDKSAIQDTLVVIPGYSAYPAVMREAGRDFPSMKELEFGPTSVYVAHGNRIFVGTNEPGGIRVYDADGMLRRIIRSGTPPEVVTAAHREQRMKDKLAGVERQQAPEQYKAEWRKNAEDARFAEVFPYYERFLVGTDGSLWVELPRRAESEGRRYVVYDSAGRGLATVRSVDRVRPYDVGPDFVLGLWRDPDEVNHVRMYRVKK